MDPFIGEVRAVGFNFAPRGWALCQGQLMSISQNTALFSLLGTTYGGDGRTTFGLPDLRSRFIVQPGQGPGLSNYVLGQMSGSESETLTTNEMPAHTHPLSGVTVNANSGAGSTAAPAGNVLASNAGVQHYASAPDAQMIAGSVAGTTTSVGGGTAHANTMPSLGMYYVIATQGIFPQRP
ncbi:MAG: tail fiber protein [Bacteroidota bacterium]|nr:tail fiber protein [Bacteroidota bacterium]